MATRCIICGDRTWLGEIWDHGGGGIRVVAHKNCMSERSFLEAVGRLTHRASHPLSQESKDLITIGGTILSHALPKLLPSEFNQAQNIFDEAIEARAEEMNQLSAKMLSNEQNRIALRLMAVLLPTFFQYVATREVSRDQRSQTPAAPGVQSVWLLPWSARDTPCPGDPLCRQQQGDQTGQAGQSQ